MHNYRTIRFLKTRHFALIIILYLLVMPAVWGQEKPVREFRGVWVATVHNIDWPSESYLTVDEQKREIKEVVNRFKELNFNAIIFQVRPSADAFYDSKLEPWSSYLTGKQGKAPDPFYDPLEYFIQECHQQGMELHAWMNPFRISLNLTDSLSENHIARQHPEWTLAYGGQRYFNPGIPAVREWLGRVTSDLVRRYEVDAIHFDDYFYPYPVDETDFPDSTAFVAYSAGFSSEHKNDWRRYNVNEMIRLLQDSIKSVKPWVKFGISPFGVWRNKDQDPEGSETQAGNTNYDDLYADILLWLKNGWIDYAMPQLYWEFGHEAADFKILADWWNMHSYGKTMLVGHGAYRTLRETSSKEWKKRDQLPRQLELVRQLPNLQGSCYFSARNFEGSLRGFTKKLKKQYYSTPALMPHMLSYDSIAPQAPVNLSVSFTGKEVKLCWEAPMATVPDDIAWFAVYRKGKTDKTPEIIAVTGSDNHSAVIDKQKKIRLKKYSYTVSALDHNWNESTSGKSIVY